MMVLCSRQVFGVIAPATACGWCTNGLEYCHELYIELEEEKGGNAPCGKHENRNQILKPLELPSNWATSYIYVCTLCWVRSDEEV